MLPLSLSLPSSLIHPHIPLIHFYRTQTHTRLFAKTHNYINKCVVPTHTRLFTKTHNYINKCVWITLLTMGVTIEYGHPLTTWVVEHVELAIGKTTISLRNEISTCFCRYAFTPCLPSNTKTLCISQKQRDPQYLKNKKMIIISNFGSTCVNCANTHCLGVKYHRAKFEKCNSKSDKQSNIV